MTTFLLDNNIEKERGGKYDTEMVPLFLLMFDAAFLLLIMLDVYV